MTWKPYIHSCSKGATLVELIVASLAGVILVGLTHSTVLQNHRLYQRDIARTELTQSLRGALDIVASEAREAGERLPEGFPALEIVDGTGDNPDQLIIRRNILDEVLVSCTDITAGASTPEIQLFSATASTPACTYPSQENAMLTWKDYRNETDDGVVKVYIFNQSTKEGEFIEYTGEDNVGGNLHITKSASAWENEYTAEYTAIYVLVEWIYEIDGDYLQVIENEDESEPLKLAYGVDNFQVELSMQDGTNKQEFLYTDSWTDIHSIDVTLSGETEYKDEIIDTSLNAKFFPRNILSN